MNNKKKQKTIQDLWLNACQSCEEEKEVDYILWELTHRCNLKCIHCRATASPTRKEHDIIQGEDALNLLGEIRKMGRPTLVFTGGEPLLRKDLLQIVEVTSEYKIPFRIQSNGLLLTEDIAKKLHDLGILNFGIGIDGPEEIHDVIRNKKAPFGCKSIVSYG